VAFKLPARESLASIASANGSTPLLEHHVQMLKASSISDEVARERGYLSATSSQCRGLGFSKAQVGGDGTILVVPRWIVKGEQDGLQIRPDAPNPDRKRYETPKGQLNKLDTHPRCVAQLKDPKVTLWLTEGAKKIDALVTRGACAIGLQGVWSWRGTNKDGGKTALACWELVALNGRRVILAFDSDVFFKQSVAGAFRRLTAFLKSRGAEVCPLWRQANAS
jgi:hypothetical protein